MEKRSKNGAVVKLQRKVQIFGISILAKLQEMKLMENYSIMK
jgi:hypothetical protein